MTRLGSPVAMIVDEDGTDDVTQHVWPNSELVTVGEPSVALRGFSKLG